MQIDVYFSIFPMEAVLLIANVFNSVAYNAIQNFICDAFWAAHFARQNHPVGGR